MPKPMRRIEIINHFERITGFTPTPHQIQVIKAIQSGKEVVMGRLAGRTTINNFLRALHNEQTAPITKE
jgi:hypothetical protein